MHFHKAIPIKIFRYLCLLTALANAGGNLGMLLFYKPILKLVGAPLPKDLWGQPNYEQFFLGKWVTLFCSE
jgi:hypothetical protein